jgi:hypothetical protein
MFKKFFGGGDDKKNLRPHPHLLLHLPFPRTSRPRRSSSTCNVRSAR